MALDVGRKGKLLMRFINVPLFLEFGSSFAIICFESYGQFCCPLHWLGATYCFQVNICNSVSELLSGSDEVESDGMR